MFFLLGDDFRISPSSFHVFNVLERHNYIHAALANDEGRFVAQGHGIGFFGQVYALFNFLFQFDKIIFRNWL